MSFPFRRVLLAAGARTLTAPLTAVAAAATTYISVRYAGTEAFGYISLLGTLFLLIPFSDLGLGAAVLNAVSRRSQSRTSERLAKDLTARAFRTLTIVGFAVIGCAAIISAGGLWPILLSAPPSLADEVNSSALVVFTLVGLGIPFGIGQRLLVADNATHLSTLILSTSSLVAVAVTALVGILSGPALFMSAATPAGILTAGIISTSVGARRLGWPLRRLVLERSRLPSLARESLWRPALPMMVVMLGAPLALQSHRLILAHFGTPAQLAEYAVAAQFYAPALSIITTGALALWPHFTANPEDREAGWLASLWLMSALGVLGAVALALLLGPISSLVTAGKIGVAPILAVSFGILLFCMSAHQPSAMLLTTPPGLWFQGLCVLLFAAVSLPLSIISVPIFGPSGPVLSTSLALIVTTLIPCVVRARKFLATECDQ